MITVEHKAHEVQRLQADRLHNIKRIARIHLTLHLNPQYPQDVKNDLLAEVNTLDWEIKELDKELKAQVTV